VLLSEVVARSAEVAATSSRTAKVRLLAELLARVPPEELPVAVAFLSGRLVQRQIGVGWATLAEPPPPAATASLTLTETDARLASVGALAGAGSAGARRGAVADLLGRATAAEQAFLRRVMAGELRQGAQEGVMVDAVARAAGVEPAGVRRALMLGGDLGALAADVRRRGVAALDAAGLRVGRPVLPMLAGTAADAHDAVARLGPCAVEWKVDGVRVQIHREGDDVAVFTRTLDDVTARMPEVVDLARTLDVRAAVLDGEAIALRPDGRPRPFQETASRVGRRAPRAEELARSPLTLFAFDLLHLDGRDLLDLPGRARDEALTAAVPPAVRVPRREVDDEAAAAAFLADAVARGHEGMMAKGLDAPYQAGARGAAWLKVKPRHTLDLVVLAAEWGHGRRTGRLSNIHLGARDEAGGFTMLGKTFKGMTDEVLEWQTARLLALETGRRGHEVHVRPELVVEVAIDGVQTSSRYPAGMALRFARVLRYRPDKSPEQADTVEAVRMIQRGHAGGTAGGDGDG